MSGDWFGEICNVPKTDFSTTSLEGKERKRGERGWRGKIALIPSSPLWRREKEGGGGNPKLPPLEERKRGGWRGLIPSSPLWRREKRGGGGGNPKLPLWSAHFPSSLF